MLRSRIVSSAEYTYVSTAIRLALPKPYPAILATHVDSSNTIWTSKSGWPQHPTSQRELKIREGPRNPLTMTSGSSSGSFIDRSSPSRKHDSKAALKTLDASHTRFLWTRNLCHETLASAYSHAACNKSLIIECVKVTSVWPTIFLNFTSHFASQEHATQRYWVARATTESLGVSLCPQAMLGGYSQRTTIAFILMSKRESAQWSVGGSLCYVKKRLRCCKPSLRHVSHLRDTETALESAWNLIPNESDSLVISNHDDDHEDKGSKTRLFDVESSYFQHSHLSFGKQLRPSDKSVETLCSFIGLRFR